MLAKLSTLQTSHWRQSKSHYLSLFWVKITFAELLCLSIICENKFYITEQVLQTIFLYLPNHYKWLISTHFTLLSITLRNNLFCANQWRLTINSSINIFIKHNFVCIRHIISKFILILNLKLKIMTIMTIKHEKHGKVLLRKRTLSLEYKYI